MHIYVGERFEELSPAVAFTLYSRLAPDAGARISEARRYGSHVIVEDAQSIADATEAENNREAIASAKLRTDIMLWRAKVYDRGELGEKVASINIHLPQLHLDALRQRTIAIAKLKSVAASDGPEVVLRLAAGEPPALSAAVS